MGELHVVVIDEDIGDKVLSLRGEGGRPLCDIWLDHDFQQRVRTPGPVPHLKNKHTWSLIDDKEV